MTTGLHASRARRLTIEVAETGDVEQRKKMWACAKTRRSTRSLSRCVGDNGCTRGQAGTGSNTLLRGRPVGLSDCIIKLLYNKKLIPTVL